MGTLWTFQGFEYTYPPGITPFKTSLFNKNQAKKLTPVGFWFL